MRWEGEPFTKLIRCISHWWVLVHCPDISLRPPGWRRCDLLEGNVLAGQVCASCTEEPRSWHSWSCNPGVERRPAGARNPVAAACCLAAGRPMERYLVRAQKILGVTAEIKDIYE